MSNSYVEESKHPSQSDSGSSQFRINKAVAVINSGTKPPKKVGCLRRLYTGEEYETDKKIDVFAVDVNDKNAVTRHLISGRVYGYANTTGTVFSNYRHYFYNNHPFFSIMLAYRGQPYNTKKRFIVFVCVLSFAIGLAYIVVNTQILHQISVCREGCTPKKNVLNKVCEGGLNNGLPYGIYDGQCAYYQPWMLSAVCGVILVPYSSFLTFCATCGCVQGRDFFQEHFAGKRIRCCLQSFGGEILLFFLLVSLAIVCATILETYLNNKGYNFVQVIVISKLWSVGIWFLWATPFFALRYGRDKRYFNNSIPSAPTPPNSPNSPA